MINFRISREAFSVSFTSQARAFGPDDVRVCTQCEIYEYRNGTPLHISSGIAILHPQDEYNVELGMKKALASATHYFSRSERQQFQQQLESWFQDGQDV